MAEFDTSGKSAKDIDSLYDEMGRKEWMDLVAKFVKESSVCEAVELFGPPVESFCKVEDVEPVKVMEGGLSRIEYKNESERISENRSGVIGIHETDSPEKAEKIMREGFKPSNEDTQKRDNSVFFWVHDVDVGENWANGKAIITEAKGDVWVSSFLNASILFEGVIHPHEYDEHHTIKYREYIDCIKRGHLPDSHYGTDNLLGYGV